MVYRPLFLCLIKDRKKFIFLFFGLLFTIRKSYFF